MTLDTPANRDEYLHIGQLDKFRTATLESVARGSVASALFLWESWQMVEAEPGARKFEEGCTVGSHVN